MDVVRIQLPGCLLIFTKQEFQDLVESREDLFVNAIRRGMFLSRKLAEKEDVV